MNKLIFIVRAALEMFTDENADLHEKLRKLQQELHVQHEDRASLAGARKKLFVSTNNAAPGEQQQQLHQQPPAKMQPSPLTSTPPSPLPILQPSSQPQTSVASNNQGVDASCTNPICVATKCEVEELTKTISSTKERTDALDKRLRIKEKALTVAQTNWDIIGACAKTRFAKAKEFFESKLNFSIVFHFTVVLW
jgi:hypothetical protein